MNKQMSDILEEFSLLLRNDKKYAVIEFGQVKISSDSIDVALSCLNNIVFNSLLNKSYTDARMLLMSTWQINNILRRQYEEK